uniref:Uncharacterized protein n=1 Tax=Bos indicus x Bos taurus TaxID=30522 RepID=A0A4W2E6I5_BOBOX
CIGFPIHQHESSAVLRIHMQLVTVQLTQLSEGTFEVVQILNSFSEGGQHLLAMGLDLGVSHYGRGRGQVAKAVKESLGPGVDDQDLASSLFHIDFAPQASDSSLLLGSKMHHDVKLWSLQVITEASEASLCCCWMLVAKHQTRKEFYSNHFSIG